MKRFWMCLAAPILALAACATDGTEATQEEAPAQEAQVEEAATEATTEQSLSFPQQVCVQGSVRRCVGFFVGTNFGRCGGLAHHGCVAAVEIDANQAICTCGDPL